MTLGVLLRLGRVSNLPTVWSNTVVALALTGVDVSLAFALTLTALMSCFYVGGMYLNDGFDAAIDARERPERPIPSGQISRRAVLGIGFSLLAFGIVGVAATGATLAGTFRLAPGLAALGLALCVVVYDLWHKGNPAGPWLMAACRLGVYLTSAWAVTDVPPLRVWLAGAGLVSYLAGLTEVAKTGSSSGKSRWSLFALMGPALVLVSVAPFSVPLLVASAAHLACTALALRWLEPRRSAPEASPPSSAHVGKAVGALIAGISLWDAALAAATAELPIAIGAGVAFLVTLRLQRHVPGT